MKTPWGGLSAPQILKKISDAGVTGQGWTSGPVSTELTFPTGKKGELLIINGAESEPYLTSLNMLMCTFPGEIIEGTAIVLKALGISRAVIGIEDRNHDAIRALQEAVGGANGAGDIRVVPVRTKYPQQGDRQMVYALTGREVPSGRSFADTGIAVLDAGAVHALYEAVVLDKPLIERYLTVSGEMVARPGNYKVRIGTRISYIMEECGGAAGEQVKIIMGGPMRGEMISNPDTPVLKSTTGILFLKQGESDGGRYYPCIRCGRCVRYCPAGLVPSDICSAVEKGFMDRAAGLSPSDCIMCGLCSWVCPSKRPISHHIRLAQENLSRK